MSMSVIKRREACLHYFRSDFDIEGTVAWVIRDFADEPSMQRAKNKEKLARNIFTMGGSGDQQELNVAAFKQASDIYSEDLRRKAVNVLEGENKELKVSLQRERDRNEELAQDYREQVNKIQDLQTKLGDAKLDALKLSSGVETTPVA